MGWLTTFLRINMLGYLTSFHYSARSAFMTAHWWRIMSRLNLTAVLVVVLSCTSSCYNYRITAPEPQPASPPQNLTVHSYFWGLLQQNVSAENCDISNALDEVTVSTNFGYAAVTVLSLGIWAPLDLNWRCAKSPGVDPDEEL